MCCFFYLGQDLLESLFSRIRSILGFNTNPTVQQLSGVLRKILVLDEIKGSQLSNCEDQLDILTISSDPKRKKCDLLKSPLEVENVVDDVDFVSNGLNIICQVKD